MLSNELNRVRAALGELAGQVGPEQWELINACRRDLEGSERYAHDLEAAITPMAENYVHSKLGNIINLLGELKHGESGNTHH